MNKLILITAILLSGCGSLSTSRFIQREAESLCFVHGDTQRVREFIVDRDSIFLSDTDIAAILASYPYGSCEAYSDYWRKDNEN